MNILSYNIPYYIYFSTYIICLYRIGKMAADDQSMTDEVREETLPNPDSYTLEGIQTLNMIMSLFLYI